MLARLPESTRRHSRPSAAALPSVLLHAGIIAGAIVATARAAPPILPPPEVLRIPLPAPTDHAPAASARHPASGLATPRTPIVQVNVPELPSLSATITDVLPDLTARVNTGGGFGRGVTSGSPGGDVGPGIGGEGASPYSASDVERSVVELPGAPEPRYPEMLRANGVQGKVIMQFVVDTLGRVEPGSMIVGSSDNEMFTAAIRAVLPRYRFVPAELGGRRVRQRVTKPFVFTLR